MKRIILQSSVLVTIIILAFSGLSYFSAYASMDDSHMKNNFMVGKIMMKANGMLSNPLKQFKHGTSISDIKCKGDFSLVLKRRVKTASSPVKISSSRIKIERLRLFRVSVSVLLILDLVSDISFPFEDDRKNLLS